MLRTAVAHSEDVLVSNAVDEILQQIKAELADAVDTLFMRVSDMLDMRLYGFRGSLKVCRNKEHLGRIYRDLFHKELGAQSFYVSDLNTIYVSGESFTAQVVGHEMTHALVSRYFVVSPSVKIHEILAKYVEYQLRRNQQQ